jgi:molecular chaperone GrpE
MSDRDERGERIEGQNEEAGIEGLQKAGELSELEELQRELEESQAKANELLDKYRRSVAEFSNYRKRQERERAQERLRIQMDVLRQVLPSLDDFDRAVAIMPPELAKQGWVEGVLLIERKLKTLLESYRVEPIQAVGEPFDPHFHSALMQEESAEYPPGTVIEEIQKGYLIEGQVLRPTLVKVAAAPSDSGNVAK